MNRGDLRILYKVIKHTKRKFPKNHFKLYLETKFFFYISVSDPSLFANKEFINRKQFVKRVHGQGLSKQIMFVTQGTYIRKKQP